MKYTQIIVLATPVFLALMALDWWIGQRRGHNSYRLHDAMASVGLGMISQLSNFLARAVGFGIYVVIYQQFSFWKLPTDAPWVWISGLALYDFLYYWNHRAGHRVALFWAAHVVHHQSQDYNLSTALRQTSTGWVAGWIFYVPMALAGYPPLVFASVALIDLLYQYWVHTQQIGRLGWFDRWFSSPSNHRVHHAVNDEYLDKNYGGILIVWDRIFGSFTEERDDLPCVYGTRLPLQSWNPIWANLQVYWEMAHDTFHAARWRDKLQVWLKPPGWRPADVAARFPKEPFDLRRVEFYDPAMAPAVKASAAALSVLTLGGVAWILWNADHLGDWQVAVGTAVAIVSLNVVSWLGSGSSASRLRYPHAP